MNLVWLKAKMKEKGVKQSDIAELLGITQGTVSKILRGDQIMKASEADNIRRYLGYRLPEDLPDNSPERQIMDVLSNLDEIGKTHLVEFLKATVHRNPDSLTH